MLALSCSFVLSGDMLSGGAQHRSEVLLSKYTRRTAVATAEEDVSRPLGQDGFRGSSRSKSPYGVHHFQNLPENFSVSSHLRTILRHNQVVKRALWSRLVNISHMP